MYKDYQKPYEDFLSTFQGIKYFQELPIKDFQFLWYVYNRGGIFNLKTISLFYDFNHPTSSRRKLTMLKAHNTIVLLFDESNYRRNAGCNARPFMYRVSNKFLGAVNNPHSHIRKTKDIGKAMLPLALTHYFLQEPNRSYILVNRRERKQFLIDRFNLQEEDLPRYFVGNTKKYVTSLNHEIVLIEDQVFLVWYPYSYMGTEFSKFAKRCKRMFEATRPHLGCLAISHSRATQAFFELVQTQRIEKKPELSSVDKVLALWEKEPSKADPSPKKRVYSFNIQTDHFPDIWQEYARNNGSENGPG
jgi:hypothetical protein